MERLDRVAGDLQVCKTRIDKLKVLHSQQDVDDEGFMTLHVKPTFPRKHNHHNRSLPELDTRGLQVCTELMLPQDLHDFPRLPAQIINVDDKSDFVNDYQKFDVELASPLMERLASVDINASTDKAPNFKPTSSEPGTSAHIDSELELEISKDLHELRKIMRGLSKSRLEVNEFIYRVDDASFLPPLPNTSMKRSVESIGDGKFFSIKSPSGSGSTATIPTGIPPPPPPPPPPAASQMQTVDNLSTQATPTKSSTSSADPVRNALMDAIKEAGGVTALRKAKARKSNNMESPATPPPTQNGLRKSNNSTPAPDIMTALTEALARRREGLKVKQLEQRQSNDADDNEW